LEGRTADDMIGAFGPVFVHIFFWVMHGDPGANLLDQFLRVLLGFFKIRVVPLFAVFES